MILNIVLICLMLSAVWVVLDKKNGVLGRWVGVLVFLYAAIFFMAQL